MLGTTALVRDVNHGPLISCFFSNVVCFNETTAQKVQ